MFARMFRLAVVVALALMAVPAVQQVEGLIAGVNEPEFVGAAVLDLLVMAGLVGLLLAGGRRPGLALVALGASAVMVFATAWLFAEPGQLLLQLAAAVMAALALWAAITKIDRMRDEPRSHFIS